MQKQKNLLSNTLNNADTQLSPVQEALYQQEKGRTGLDDYDYDMRGYYKEFGSLTPSGGLYSNGHFIDKYKKPNHPTFSNESQYNNTLTGNGLAQGGQWVNNGNSWSFYATPYNLTQYSPEELQDYFNFAEKDNSLIMPYYL